MSESPINVERLWVNANVTTMAGNTPYGTLLSAAVAVAGDRITWVGPHAELPRSIYRQGP